jgi:hypothetical protein
VKFKEIIPTGPEVGREVIIVLLGVLGAAFILSRFPQLQQFVTSNSLTVKNDQGAILF